MIEIVDCFEFSAVDGHQIFPKMSQLLTLHNKLATYTSDVLAVVFSKVGDGLEIRHQTPGQVRVGCIRVAVRRERARC